MTKLDKHAAKNSERTDRTEAREALGTSGGLNYPRSNSGFGRWLRKHEDREKSKRDLRLTIPAESEKETRETTTPRSVTGAADIELSQTLGETKNLDERKSLEADQRKHLLFRTHRYMPSMTSPADRPLAHPQIEPGAYRREKGGGYGLVNMANEHEIDRRN